MMRPSLALLSLSVFVGWGPPDVDPPVELGQVEWDRDLEGALARAEARRPVFALFQEIPGCVTCRNFGRGPLSHPLLVEAIEELFVPLAVYNNRPGADAAVLARYDEPAWNNPVVRFLDPEGQDVVPRRAKVWQTGPLAGRMVAALEAVEAEVPLWLQVVSQEERELAEATVAMHCFWEGEVRLGALSGVVETRAAWLGGREVVRVRYDPERVSYERLVAEADRLQCAVRVFAENEAELDAARGLVGNRAVLAEGRAKDAPDSDHLRRLRRTSFRWLPLTPMQRTKVNAALGSGGDPGVWLSPGQKQLLARLEDLQARHPERLEGFEAPREVLQLVAYSKRLESLLEERSAR